VKTYQELCRHPSGPGGRLHVPDFRLQPIEICAETKKHVQVQKPMSTNIETARKMLDVAHKSRHHAECGEPAPFRRFSPVLRSHRRRPAGQILQADAYVKWYRSDEYYSRPIRAAATEGGGALINQGFTRPTCCCI
jgi:predicted dehydrogenase